MKKTTAGEGERRGGGDGGVWGGLVTVKKGLTRDSRVLKTMRACQAGVWGLAVLVRATRPPASWPGAPPARLRLPLARRPVLPPHQTPCLEPPRPLNCEASPGGAEVSILYSGPSLPLPQMLWLPSPSTQGPVLGGRLPPGPQPLPCTSPVGTLGLQGGAAASLERGAGWSHLPCK